MRKYLSVIFMIFAFAILSAVTAFGAEGGKTVVMQIDNPVITVDGAGRNIDESNTVPTIINDRTYIPVRGLIEAIGGSAQWDNDTKTAVLNYGSDEIRLTIDSTTAYYNNTAVEIDTAPVIVNGRTMLPARFIAESFGFDVEWDSESKTITISETAGEVSTEITTAEETTELTTAEVTEADIENEGDGSKILVAYFSNTGNTESVANKIAEVTGGDIFEIQPSDPYTEEDLNYNVDDCRANNEQNDPTARPEIANSVENMDDYDIVFIGYPIWWGDAPKIICTFMESYDFTDKTVIPFCTSGSSGISTSENTLKSLADANWLDGQRFDRGVSEESIDEWLTELGIN